MVGVRPRRRGHVLALTAALTTMLVGVGADASRTVSGLAVPAGYRASHATISTGVDIFTLVRPRRAVVHLARIRRDAPVRMVPVLSRNAIAGPAPRLETTSSMCRRVRCLVAINGDYFTTAGAPVGGMITDGEPVRSARSARPHVVMTRDDGFRVDSPIAIGMTLTVHYPVSVLGVEVHDTIRRIDLGALNVERRDSGINVYTARFGPKTMTRDSAQLILADVRPASGLYVPARIVGFRAGGSAPIPRGGAVLSGTGDGADVLASIWHDVQRGAASPDASVYSDTGDAVQAVAGKTVLLRDARIVTGWRAIGPQSAIGWSAAGDLYLVTVDGRRPGYSLGLGARDVAAMLRSMGVRTAIGLDNGGSTTFSVRGALSNRPSDRLVRRGKRTVRVRFPARGDRIVRSFVERPVSNAIAVVAN